MMDLRAQLEQLARDWEGYARELAVEVDEHGYATNGEAADDVAAEVYAECAAALRRRLQPSASRCDHSPAALQVVEWSQCECGALVDSDTGQAYRLHAEDGAR